MSSRPAFRLGRWATLAMVALLLLGALMAVRIGQIGLGDASSTRRGGLLAYKVRPESGRAGAFAAAQYHDMGDHARAEQLAREALLRSPFEVVAIRTLGQASNARNPGSGDGLMVLAARLGWRDQPTQLWVIERAILAGEPLLAMQRAEALVRLQQQREIVFTLLRALGAEPAGRRVLVRSLAEDPFWRHNFLSPDEPAGVEQMRVMAAILTDLVATRVPPRAVEARYAIDGLAAGGALDEAMALHRRLFPRSREAGNFVADGGFERADSDYRTGSSASVFDWRFSAQGGSVAGRELGNGAAGHALVATAGGASPGRIAEQALMLRPGRYVLSYRVRANQAGAAEQLRWRLLCRDGDRLVFETPSAALPTEQWEVRSHGFAVPGDCGVQLLTLEAMPAGGMAEAIAYFDEVAVRPAG